MDEVDIGAFYPQAYSIAEYIAWQEDHVEDLVQYGMTQLLIAIRQAHRSGTTIRNPKDFAADIFFKWMKWWYTPADRENRVVFLEDQPQHQTRLVNKQEAFRTIYIQEYLAEVKRMLGPVEHKMAQELLTPSEGVVDRAMQEMERKQALKAQGRRVRGADTLVLKQEHIRHELGMGEGQWEGALKRLRSFTRSWLDETGQPQSLSSPSTSVS